MSADASNTDSNEPYAIAAEKQKEQTKSVLNSVPNGTAPTISNDSNKGENVPEISQTKISDQTPIPNKPDVSYERIKSTFSAMNSQVSYLVHWENTVHSGGVLGAILAFLVLTAYSSLFNILCGLAVFAIGADWIYVLVTKQVKTIVNQDASNPHEKYLKNPPQVKKEDLDKYVDVWVDIVNLSLVEATKIALIEDPLRSLKYVGIVYAIWTVASWFTFRTIIALVVITGFAVPKAYQQNRDEINEHLGTAQNIAKGYIDRGVDIVNKNTGNLVSKAGQFAMSKGLIPNPDAAKKQE